MKRWKDKRIINIYRKTTDDHYLKETESVLTIPTIAVIIAPTKRQRNKTEKTKETIAAEITNIAIKTDAITAIPTIIIEEAI